MSLLERLLIAIVGSLLAVALARLIEFDIGRNGAMDAAAPAGGIVQERPTR
jgi:hypothetical protein